MKRVWTIARKELQAYFGSPLALIFTGAYLAVTLFTFFWVDAFFARGIADVRPLFRWTPVLMIFLVGALSMRQWSEEQRTGTIEVLMTLPVSSTELVLGKFLAILAQVCIALALTIFLPITVSLLGNLDWGPVFGGYLAAILLASAYAAIGLFVSSRTDNQIVALISTVMLCGLFYLAGSAGVTDFVGERAGDILRAIGTGSRFKSIERGVIDLRDLIYYLSLTGIFLLLNVVSVDSKRWSTGEITLPYRRDITLTSTLLVLNLVLVNVWLYPLHNLRLDLTAQHQYSLSRATRDLLSNLQEPILVRGYFSEKTHPLLAPLVSEIRDMLEEYRVASNGMMQLEFIDPAKDPEKEAEANQTYGISPTPFQVAGRYETSIVNAYFDILIRYGDQNVVLNFRDLIEIEVLRDGNVNVRLRNLEYDLTSAIKKVVYGFQSVDAVLASLDAPAELTLYVTPNDLPEWLKSVPNTIEKVAKELAQESHGKLVYRVVDPDSSSSGTSRQQLYDEYGIRPFAVSPFSNESYYLHMLLKAGDQTQVVYPSGNLSEADIRTAIESALKRSAHGFLQVVGLWMPPQNAPAGLQGQMPQPLSSWQEVAQCLRQEYELRYLDLRNGQVPSDVDVLVVIAPQNMDDKQRYAIDQYLMRGGSVILAAGRYGITTDQFSGGLTLKELEGGVQDLLMSYGIEVEPKLVLDVQNEPFPVVARRNVGGFQIQEIQAVNYPFFVDIRADGMAKEHPIVSNLPAVTMNWASPIKIDESKNANRNVTELLRSSPQSWTQETTDIQPNFQLYPELGFPKGDTQGPFVLAVAVQGRFESAFKGKPSPLEQESTNQNGHDYAVPGTIEYSPEHARLVVIGSAEFVDDVVFDLSSRLTMDRYVNSLKFMQNSVAWATEDLDLLEIRARGSYTRLLHPLSERAQSFWETLNYALALLALIAVGLLGSARRRNEQPLELIPPEEMKS